jgi:hypothetical protein
MMALFISDFRTHDRGKVPKSAIFEPVRWMKFLVLRPNFEWISNLNSKFLPRQVDKISGQGGQGS